MRCLPSPFEFRKGTHFEEGWTWGSSLETLGYWEVTHYYLVLIIKATNPWLRQPCAPFFLNQFGIRRKKARKILTLNKSCIVKERLLNRMKFIICNALLFSKSKGISTEHEMLPILDRAGKAYAKTERENGHKKQPKPKRNCSREGKVCSLCVRVSKSGPYSPHCSSFW